MSISQSRLKLILSEFPDYVLREIIEEKEIGFRGRKEDLVNKLSEQDWSDSEVDEFKDRLRRVKEEQATMSYFILAINVAPNLRSVEEFFEANSIERDEEGDIIDGGWEVIDVTDTELIAQKWKVVVDEGYDPFSDSRTVDTTKENVSVTVDLDEDRVFIETTNYGKANSVRSNLEDAGFSFDNIGHHTLTADTARIETNQFILDLESDLESIEESQHGENDE